MIGATVYSCDSIEMLLLSTMICLYFIRVDEIDKYNQKGALMQCDGVIVEVTGPDHGQDI